MSCVGNSKQRQNFNVPRTLSCCKPLITVKQLATIKLQLLEVQPSSPQHTLTATPWLQLQAEAVKLKAGELFNERQLLQLQGLMLLEGSAQLQAAHMLAMP
jgi:hypothetical protein